MRRIQYDALAKRVGHYFGEDMPRLSPLKGGPVRLMPKSGRREGQIGLLVGNLNGRLTLRFADPPDQSYPYVSVDEVDDDGVVKPSLVTDMTGREVGYGAVVCYSVCIDHTHACEIGKVKAITPSGMLCVRPFRRNGQKLSATERWRERTNITPDRALLLPVDLSMVTLWLLGDFENFRQDEA